MRVSPSSINWFTFFKLPAAWWTGVRLTHIDSNRCEVRVRHRWINQNPFRSMFWAVQGMAAELSTGALVSAAIRLSKKPVSMLVLNNKGSFTKKARGLITFKCEQGTEVNEVIEKVIRTGGAETITLYSEGHDETGEKVSSFAFEWTLKTKTNN